MSFFEDLPSSESENDVEYVPEFLSDEELISVSTSENRIKIKSRRSHKLQPTLAETGKVETSSDETEKKKAEDLYKNFLSEVENISSVSRISASESVFSAVSEVEVSAKNSCDSQSAPQKHSASEHFDFVGETVSISKDSSAVSEESDSKKMPLKHPVPRKKGLEAVMGIIKNKKTKLSILDESILDWKYFKQKEGIEQELRFHNKGKGYIERMRFLERSDLRSYEIERDMKLSRKNKT